MRETMIALAGFTAGALVGPWVIGWAWCLVTRRPRRAAVDQAGPVSEHWRRERIYSRTGGDR